MSVSRSTVLNKIYTELRYGFYYVAHTSNFSTSILKAESLVELLELSDRGNKGGFKPCTLVEKRTGHLLYDRFLALVAHDKDDTLGEIYRDELADLTEKFTKLAEL